MLKRRRVEIGSFLVAAAIFCVAADAQTARRRAMPRMPEIPPEQSLTVAKAEIVIKDTCANDLAGMFVIIDSRDGTKHFPYEEAGRLVVDTTEKYRFDAKNAPASLHFPNMRTDCVKAIPDWEHRRAVFIFNRCSTKPVSDVTIRMEEEFDISYVRILEAPQFGTVPCRERASFNTADDYIVRAVRFPSEKLVLQLGRDQPDPKASGVRIDKILKLIPDLTRPPADFVKALSGTVAVESEEAPDAIADMKNSGFTRINSDEMAYVVTVQRADGDGSTPRLSSVSIDLVSREMKKYGPLHIKVQPGGSQ